MVELDFKVEEAQPERVAAAPMIRFRLRIAERLTAAGEPTTIQALALRCQIQIEPARRRYEGAERERLLDLFGTPERWGQTLRPFLWTHVDTIVRTFVGRTAADLLVPCSYDFSLAATKYFDAVLGGDIPLCFLFSGTVFYEDGDGRMQVARVPWEKEAYFRLDASIWNGLMELYYPNGSWLCLRKDVFDRLNAYRSRHGFMSWEQAVEALVPVGEFPPSPRPLPPKRGERGEHEFPPVPCALPPKQGERGAECETHGVETAIEKTERMQATP